MSSVWRKLFTNHPAPANEAEQSPFRHGARRETTRRASSASDGQATPKSQKVARTFDAIGRRNEDLRAQLDAVEFSFRNIEAIRARFHETLIPIDQTLAEIERTKIAHVEAERKLAALTLEHGRVKGEHAALTLERSALIVKQDDLRARIGDLERAVTTAEIASSEALATLAERTAKLGESSASWRTISSACKWRMSSFRHCARNSQPKKRTFRTSSNNSQICVASMIY